MDPGMLPSRHLEKFLQPIHPDFQDIVLELRSLIASVAPDVTETAHRNGFSYYYRERGGPVSAGVCQIGIHEDHVRLAFIHGAFLPDPKGLLEGPSRYKRFVRLRSYEDAPWDDLKALIIASSRFDPYTLQFKKQ
jgi:hypothetical protein